MCEEIDVCEVGVADVAKKMSEMYIMQYTTKGKERGIDAYYEIRDTKNYGFLFAGQIKSGKSYIKGTNCYVYDVKKEHISLWRSLSIPMFLFVYDPEENKTYWIDIQEEINNNPQVDNDGYVFSFPKEGNELIKLSKEMLIDKVLAKSGRLDGAFSKAKFKYNAFKNLSKQYYDDTQPNLFAKTGIHENHIRQWLLMKGFTLDDASFFNEIIMCIENYYNGLGIVGSLIQDDAVVSIHIREDINIIIDDINGNRTCHDNVNGLYNFAKMLSYFGRFIKEKNAVGEICVFNGIEVIISRKPVCSPEAIYIQKKMPPLALHRAFIDKLIPYDCMPLLEKISSGNNRILINGENRESGIRFLTALTSLFNEDEDIITVEDRREISILKGNHKKAITSVSSSVHQLTSKICEAVNEECDKIIFSIGNYTPDNILPYVLKYIKSNSIVFDLYTVAQNEVTPDDIFYLIERDGIIDRSMSSELINNIDFYIKIGHDRKNGFCYLSEIWQQINSKWEMIYKNNDPKKSTEKEKM